MQKIDLAYLNKYKIEYGVIRTRGLYYSERRFVPYFHAKCDGGHYNYHERGPDGEMWHVCIVTEAERDAFPELFNVATVGIMVDRGKVCSWTRSCLYAKR